jgi:long-chain acyl-CoA synthetase
MTISVADATKQLVDTNPMFAVSEAVVRDVPMRVWTSCPPSLRFLLELSRGYGPATYLVYEDERLTYEEHFEKTAALARYMHDDLGVRAGDRVAIAMRNFPEWVVSFWATAALGAVVVPLNAWWTGPELAYGLEDSGSAVAFVDLERMARLTPYLESLVEHGLAHLVVVRADADNIPTDAPVPVSSFGDAFALHLPLEPGTAPLPPVDIDPDDDATMFYTSGTTGKPKGAVGTQRNICSNLLSLAFVAARSALLATGEMKSVLAGGGSQNVHLLSVPLFHATGCHAILVANTAAGGKLVMMRRWNPERALELIEREKVTVFGGVPTMAWQVLESPDFATRDTSSVRSVAYGGAPAPPKLVRRIHEHFPAGSPSVGYGLTETSSVTTMNTGQHYIDKPDSVGPPVPVVELKVVDEEGSELPPGATGELWIKGPNIVKGYWGKPEETTACFTDGWLHSGDLARIDFEGDLYIVDRAKDMVIRGGENVYSVEVEAALFEYPAVSDVAVIGLPHEVLGEEVGAVVLLRQGVQVSAEDLRDHLAERLAAFKIPTRIFFVDEPLPRNAAGKVLKRDLRAKLIGGVEAPK